MDQEIPIESGDKIKVLSGENKGETGKIIAVYNNSASIELDKKEKNGRPLRIVLGHKKYELMS